MKKKISRPQKEKLPSMQRLKSSIRPKCTYISNRYKELNSYLLKRPQQRLRMTNHVGSIFCVILKPKY